MRAEQREQTMKDFLKTITTSLGIAVIASALAPRASAGCGAIPVNQAQASFINAAYRPGHFVLVDDDSDNAPIIGMWNVLFTSPDGKTVIDFGYQQWHSDGTELMNSGGHDPATGNFCMGVWAHTGNHSYKLNHYALSYDKSTGTLAVVVNIHEEVTVAHGGGTFAGTFTLDVYPYDAKTGTTASTPVQSIAGVISGKRITAN
jgi:hypothetical protein